ncbi:hypothetical protein [Phenylobacterium aquaticum]|uniref:hypothetical protein n=1 Tax=Phenylobacterium aquaticum TaxID=1763816 RepID=UPI0026EA0C67|nr:hypothetical protein [Phenylobacterium aquaticum]
MSSLRAPIVAVLSGACALLAACGARPTPSAVPASESQVGAGYLTPPAVSDIVLAGGQMLMSGTAAPLARVRLATPTGETSLATADAAGLWRLSAPAQPSTALYGLSQTAGDRTVQAEGYVMVTPSGAGFLLRAGAGAVRLGRPPQQGITAVDFDREGATVISGRAPAGASLSAWVDGRRAAEARADATGAFSLSLNAPLRPGGHDVKVFGDSVDSRIAFSAAQAQPLVSGPFRVEPTPGGVRVDWITPGGGVQSTVVAAS